MTLSVSHMWAKTSLCVFVWLSLRQGRIFTLAADHTGLWLCLASRKCLLLVNASRIQTTWLLPVPTPTCFSWSIHCKHHLVLTCKTISYGHNHHETKERPFCVFPSPFVCLQGGKLSVKALWQHRGLTLYQYTNLIL